MATTFVYSIALNIPGGSFTASTSGRLSQLIEANIATQLSEISSDGEFLTVRFATDITTEEKTTLDGDQIDPAAGLIARSADFVELSYQGQPLSRWERIVTSADGITSISITSQIKDGNGAAIKGSSEVQDIETLGLAPVNKSKETVDGSGTSSFVVGPSFDRGVVSITVRTESFPNKDFEVEFE